MWKFLSKAEKFSKCWTFSLDFYINIKITKYQLYQSKFNTGFIYVLPQIGSEDWTVMSELNENWSQKYVLEINQVFWPKYWVCTLNEGHYHIPKVAFIWSLPLHPKTFFWILGTCWEMVWFTQFGRSKSTRGLYLGCETYIVF